MFRKISARILALLLCVTLALGAGIGITDFGMASDAPQSAGGGTF